jgi:hypothetical protein
MMPDSTFSAAPPGKATGTVDGERGVQNIAVTRAGTRMATRIGTSSQWRAFELPLGVPPDHPPRALVDVDYTTILRSSMASSTAADS